MTIQTTIETRKRHYYHKGDHTLVCYEDEVPEGYIPGPSAAWKKKRNDTYIKRYGVRSPSQLEEVKNKLREKALTAKRKREQTLIEKYGVDNAMKAECIKQKMSHIISSEEVQEKTRRTCRERYGVDSVAALETTKQKMKETLEEHYGVDTPLKSRVIKDKKDNTMLERYGVTCPLECSEIKKRRQDTLRKNKTFNTSLPEESTYQELVQKYGEDDVLREYTDSRYPFKCDFYIKSKDLFIELNLHPSHGEHPFDPESIEDQRLVEELRAKGDTWSNMIVDVWTERDYNKIKFMKDNNLNYILIYPKDYYRKED